MPSNRVQIAAVRVCNYLQEAPVDSQLLGPQVAV